MSFRVFSITSPNVGSRPRTASRNDASSANIEKVAIWFSFNCVANVTSVCRWDFLPVWITFWFCGRGRVWAEPERMRSRSAVDQLGLGTFEEPADGLILANDVNWVHAAFSSAFILFWYTRGFMRSSSISCAIIAGNALLACFWNRS